MAQTAKKQKPERPAKRQKTASEIYKMQNTIIHQAFSKCGMPYEENKETWISLCSEIAQRDVDGLKELTLLERRTLILHLQARLKGVRIWNPGVPKPVARWKKGDAETGYEMIQADDSQLRMIYALWVELGYEPRTLRGMVKKRYQVDDEHWLQPHQLTACINYLLSRIKAKHAPA